jgi:hypothetical protein
MQIINLDATKWKTVADFYTALLSAIGAPQWHSHSPDALIDSMIWGGINAIEPPYTIRISGTVAIPKQVIEEIELVKNVLAEGRLEYQNRRGGDVEVVINIAS